MNFSKIKDLILFFIILDLPELLKELLIRGGALVGFMMAVEFAGALIGGHGVDIALDWALAIIWPTVKVAFGIVVLLSLLLSKRSF